MSTEAIYLASLGASTALGRNAWSSAAAVRAGIAGFTQHPYMIDKAGEPMRVASAPWLDADLTGRERFQALLMPAIDQALGPMLAAGKRLRCVLALALPEARPGVDATLAQDLMSELRSRYSNVFSAFGAFQHGHAAGLLALNAAYPHLSNGSLDACVIAGVDSYLTPRTLDWLEASDQLHSAGPLNNAWGFIPGEGAGAVLIVRAGVADSFASLLGRVLAVGVATEANRIKTNTVCIGEGLTAAFRGALQALPPEEKVTDVYCDMNGEPYRADEYGFTCLRTKEYFESASDFVSPADCWGDVGAAGATLHLALAAIAGAKRYANGRVACVWASSENGQRAAAVMRFEQGASDAR